MRFIFGPVSSRRLGRSLGVDIIPYKTCTLDCLYCECGPTTDLTLCRRTFMPVGEILTELSQALSEGVGADFITLSGSGEPTLYEPLGELIRGIKGMSALPVAVLTNSTLLHVPEVAEALRGVDLVVPSLDSATMEGFRAVNRPHLDLELPRMVEALAAFVASFSGQVWLEVLLVGGMNDTEAELEALRGAIERIRPDRVQVGTVDRLPAEARIRSLTQGELEQACRRLGPLAEVLGAALPRGELPRAATDEQITAMAARRPMTAEEMARLMGVPPSRALGRLLNLEKQGLLRRSEHEGRTFFVGVKA